MSGRNFSVLARQKVALSEFAVNNRELDQLEAHLRQFNIFDAIGVTRQELRHSDFLSFLLNPGESHGFDDLFAKRLLQRAVSPDGDSAAISAIDLELMSLSGLELRREWKHIDILMIHAQQQIAAVIENKLGTREHSGQLRRYSDVVEREFPGYRLLFLYLTPDRDPPSDDRYLALSYDDVAQTLNSILEDRRPALDPGVQTIVAHYIRMLRRHVVNNSEVADLCRRIYAKHKEALDLIYEHRPNLESELHDFLLDLVKTTDGLVLDHSEKHFIRFLLPEWDVPVLKQAKGWTRSNRIMLLEVHNFLESLKIGLLIGPGPDEVRDVLVHRGQANPPPFQTRETSTNRTGKKWTWLFGDEILRPNDFEPDQIETMKGLIQNRWETFFREELPALRAGMQEAIAALEQAEPRILSI